MVLAIDLTAEEEARLQTEARRQGLPVMEYARRRLLGRSASKPFPLPGRNLSAHDLLATAPDVRRAHLQAAAADAASMYEADLHLPPSERELTALTALDGEPFHEYE